jgi:metal-responsive CopG/Arc/MetJ family transcriptional regulator
MALPPKLAPGKASHTLKTRVPRYLWHEFLVACRAEGYRSASAALREAMRFFIHKSKTRQKRRIVLGGPPSRPKFKK